MNNKLRVAILFGGRSAEHEVSLQSAKNILEHLNRDKYEPLLIGIDKEGNWKVFDEALYLLNKDDPQLIKLPDSQNRVSLVIKGNNGDLMELNKHYSLGKIDVAFPVIHGPYGEDGSVQGLLKLANIPYVGADVAASAVGMDKDLMKRLLRDADIKTARFLTYHKADSDSLDFFQVREQLGMPVFIKPANLGSSVGVVKACNEMEFYKAMKTAFQFDTKILVEEFIPGRELECAVLGNHSPKASVVGEILAQDEFYSYHAKYLDEQGARLDIPANIPRHIESEIQELAIQVFKVLCCSGMARVDFFLKADHSVVVNEINTIPGFTRISMYPMLWKQSGIEYQTLIDELLTLALEKHAQERTLKTSL